MFLQNSKFKKMAHDYSILILMDAALKTIEELAKKISTFTKKFEELYHTNQVAKRNILSFVESQKPKSQESWRKYVYKTLGNMPIKETITYLSVATFKCFDKNLNDYSSVEKNKLIDEYLNQWTTDRENYKVS